MALITTVRNTTYVAGVSEVKADDLNDLQDSVIALHERATRIFNIAPASGFGFYGFTPPRAQVFGVLESLTSSATNWTVPLRLSEGDTLDFVEVYGIEPNNITEAYTLSLHEHVLGVAQQIADIITSGNSGGAATHRWDETTNDAAAEIPYTVPANGVLHLRITMPATTTFSESQIVNVRVGIR